MIQNNTPKINPFEFSTIYVQFEMNRETVANILDREDKAPLENIVEING